MAAPKPTGSSTILLPPQRTPDGAPPGCCGRRRKARGLQLSGEAKPKSLRVTPPAIPLPPRRHGSWAMQIGADPAKGSRWSAAPQKCWPSPFRESPPAPHSPCGASWGRWRGPGKKRCGDGMLLNSSFPFLISNSYFSKGWSCHYWHVYILLLHKLSKNLLAFKHLLYANPNFMMFLDSSSTMMGTIYTPSVSFKRTWPGTSLEWFTRNNILLL